MHRATAGAPFSSQNMHRATAGAVGAEVAQWPRSGRAVQNVHRATAGAASSVPPVRTFVSIPSLVQTPDRPRKGAFMLVSSIP